MKTRSLAKLWSVLLLPGLAGGLACSAGEDDGGAAPDADDGASEVPCREGCETGAQQSPEQARSVCDNSKQGPRTLRRLTAQELRATLQDIFPEVGPNWVTKMSVDVASKLAFSNDASTLLVNANTAKAVIKTAEDLANIVTDDAFLSSVLPCATNAADVACATEYVNAKGLRLFRRPLTADETTRYVSYQQSVAQRSDFKTGIKWATVAMIQSPHALYRREIGTDNGEGAFALDQYELATELAYVYTASTPDSQLLQAAAEGVLATKQQLRAQAQRLLTQHSRRLEPISSFFFEWLQYGKVRGQSRVDAPTFADELSVQMIDETQTFLNTIVFGDNGGVRELMTANYTAVTPALGEFYGFGNNFSDSFTKVERPPGQGIGILAQGSILASTAHQDYTSPTLRGLLFYTRFLCNSRPKPPDVVPPIEETAGGTNAKTTREKFEIHHNKGACASCHKPFEPFGYTLEQFDETGRYRATEDGEPLNTVATVAFPDDSTAEITSLEDLAMSVDDNDAVANCMSGMLAAYMFSGAGGQNCLAEPERKKVAAGEMSIQQFLIELTQAPHFTVRR